MFIDDKLLQKKIKQISLIAINDEDETTAVNRHIKVNVLCLENNLLLEFQFTRSFQQEIIYHPNQSSLTKRNDIALLRLKRTISFSDNVKPACLQTSLRDEPPNVKLIVTGWGIISGIDAQNNN